MAELGLAAAQTLLAVLQYSELKDLWSIWGYRSKLEDLEKTVTTVTRVLKDAESKELSYEQQGYVNELNHVVYEADDLFDEFNTLLELKQLGDKPPSMFNRIKKKVGRFLSCKENKLCVATRMFRKAQDIQNRLTDIADRHDKFGLTIGYKPICLRGKETCSYVDVKEIIGRDDDEKAIVEKLLESKGQDVRFLAIVGVGGVGKTAIAKLVYNNDAIKKEFGDSLFWVCVSDQDKQNFDVKAILSNILKLVGIDHQISLEASNSLELLQRKFQNALGWMKFMLVLDDLWNEDKMKWEVLQSFLMIGHGGSRILVTTRSQNTATIVASDAYTYKLDRLSSHNSWKLFKMAAFIEEENQSKELLEIGKKIVAKCFNIPLAIKVIGSLLYGEEISKWRLFEESNLANINKYDNRGENQIMSVLKLSYHNLQTSLKSCFSYCAIFPKDFKIKKERLISQWMAHGYIVPTCENQNIEHLAEEHFSKLLQRCFFQDVEKFDSGDIYSFKIHDLMHDVAQEMARREIRIINNSDDKIEDAVYHVASACYYNPDMYSAAANLRSYINVSKALHCSSVAEHLKYLRVLDARGIEEVEKLINSIGKLFHLKYLDISNTLVRELPVNSISKLHNLQTLLLYKCFYLQKLPDDLNKLKKLRHLDINGCIKLSYMPSGMDKMTSLKVLTDFMVGEKDHPIGEQPYEEFKGLETLTSLKGGIDIYIGRKYRNVEQPMSSGSYLSQMKGLDTLFICFGSDCEDPEGCLKRLEPHPNLKVINLLCYEGLTIPWWQQVDNNGSSYTNLVSIRLFNCINLQNLPLSFGKLPNLKSLTVGLMQRLEYIEETSSIGSQFFRALESLAIIEMPNLKSWFRKEDLADDVDNSCNRSFPLLSMLIIFECPKLESFYQCPNLKTLNCDNEIVKQQVVGEGNNVTFNIGTSLTEIFHSILGSIHCQY